MMAIGGWFSWNLENYVNPIEVEVPVLVLDGGFFGSHSDLDISISNLITNPTNLEQEEHGTHVAGIIGATHNGPTSTSPYTQVGIDGINPFAKITGLAYSSEVGILSWISSEWY